MIFKQIWLIQPFSVMRLNFSIQNMFKIREKKFEISNVRKMVRKLVISSPAY